MIYRIGRWIEEFGLRVQQFPDDVRNDWKRKVDAYYLWRYGPVLGPHPSLNYIWRKMQKDLMTSFEGATGWDELLEGVSE